MLNKLRARRKRSIRARLKGTSSKPRLSVFRSHKHIYAQLIDDSSGKTLASVSSLKIKNKVKKSELAFKVGEMIGGAAKSLNIKQVVFDRGAYRYHGRVRKVAEGARSKGLNF